MVLFEQYHNYIQGLVAKRMEEISATAKKLQLLSK
jgi:hypothetical protein